MREAGFTVAQAEAQAEALAEVIEQQIATKRDLKETEQRIIIKLGAMIAASMAITISILQMG